jgi:hypothetical protein
MTTITPEGKEKAVGWKPISYPLPLSAHDLAWITEEAEGVRDKHLQLVEYKGQNKAGLIDATTFDPTKHENPIDVVTRSLEPDRVKVEKVTLKPENFPAQDCPPDWDCLFWSEASIEKFFLPYYLSHRLLEPEEIAALKGQLRDKNLIGFAHFTPSRWDPVRAGETGGVVYIDKGQLTFEGLLSYVARLMAMKR